MSFESVKKELNRAMINNQIISNALPGAFVRRVECWKICVMHLDANVINSVSFQTIISFLSIVSRKYQRLSTLLKAFGEMSAIKSVAQFRAIIRRQSFKEMAALEREYSKLEKHRKKIKG